MKRIVGRPLISKNCSKMNGKAPWFRGSSWHQIEVGIGMLGQQDPNFVGREWIKLLDPNQSNIVQLLTQATFVERIKDFAGAEHDPLTAGQRFRHDDGSEPRSQAPFP